ncbi:MAG: biotin transporter BioY [SAR202 cluster bacterium]|nr:biotin transporter BioY [SAR202 cluster bacterium]
MQLTNRAVLADVLYPRDWAKTREARIAKEAILIVGFAAFVALCAQVIVRLPFTTVPITGQTFATLVAGGALGAWRGAASLSVYLVAGMFLPVYAPSSPAGVVGESSVHFIFPWNGTSEFPWDLSSGGYILGFVLAAALAGFIAERGWDRKPWLIGGFLASNALIYVPGLLWLSYLISTEWIHPAAGRPLGELIAGSGTWEKTLVGGLYPFILGDLIKLYLATLTLPLAWKLVEKFRKESG